MLNLSKSDKLYYNKLSYWWVYYFSHWYYYFSNKLKIVVLFCHKWLINSRWKAKTADLKLWL